MSQVLTLFTTPVIYLYFDRLATRLSGRRRRNPLACRRRGLRMNLSAPFIARPVATTLLTIGIALAGCLAFLKLPVSPLPASRFSDDSGAGAASRREPGDRRVKLGKPA